MAKSRSISPVPEGGVSHIVFPSCTIASFSRVDPSSGEVKFHCELPLKGTDKLFERMNWQMPGDTTTEQGLEGKLEGGNFILTAKDKLVSPEVDIGYKEIKGFKCFRFEIKKHKGKGYRRELRMTATFDASEPTALAKLEAYQFVSDNAMGSLKVNYVIRPEQQELGASATEEQRQAGLEIVTDDSKVDFGEIRKRIDNPPN
jgi:hypothetical protein